ncbi:MAG: HAMP domain-containing protein [Rhizobiales bacterium]|nr:HAMP domain-containing protein [Hyphomicrobiales bacterium]
MTALGKLFRTTTFKLTLVYLTVFALFAAFLLAYFAWNTRRLVTQQIVATVDAEISGLSYLYQQGGIRRLIFAIDDRGGRPGSSLYLLTTAAGEGVTGNIGSLTTGILDKSGWTETAYRRIDDPDSAAEHRALVRVLQLPGGFRLLVGRDLEERERLHDIIVSAGRWSIAIVVVLGIAGGFFITRRVLKRVDAMTDTTQRIMAGDLSGRLPIAGSNDELDRLADNLNAMLERIEALMHGLKEVTDNIAHDLKTPLTRLRNRVEEALRTAEDESQYRAALEHTIEESDGLIATFNALLMIARAESGQARDGMTTFDAAEIAHGVGELYEPLADEKGLTLRVEAPESAPMYGNRELVSQALANLVDNAIKYAAPAPSFPSLSERAATPVSGGPCGGESGKETDQPPPVNGMQPEIVVKAVAGDGDQILLTVADAGPGIPADDRARAVERFVRLEQSRSQPGSGLGLSLANAVARLHGGELRLEDNQPGLRTVLALPRGTADPSPATPAASREPVSAPRP